MKVHAYVHNELVFNRRVQILTEHFANLLPTGAKVLDVGCGDGSIDRLICERRPDITIKGIDAFVRAQTHIPVTKFDGSTLLYENRRRCRNVR